MCYQIFQSINNIILKSNSINNVISLSHNLVKVDFRKT